ncbi:MAG TPA: sterol desaturase family protein [Beijerinckiaceae bacterium]|nr:sterol desaturase family protein [Beijerinckiaceae bacterium]
MSETALRLSLFAGVLAGLVLWELLQPWRDAQQRLRRWPSNFAIVLLDSLIVRLIFPLTAAGVALFAEIKGWGLFALVGAPFWLALPASVILLDLAIYAQHVAFHHVPLLWRFHRMHHADTVLDVSTGLRFHPVEIVLSMLIKFGAVLALGAPPEAVIAFEVLLNATAMFNHANIVLPERLDRLLRLVVVTPAMHRVHHSAIRAETDSNFGFNLPWWDRLFGTYQDGPRLGYERMIVGLDSFRADEEARLDRMLTQPFRRPDKDG